MLRWVGEEREIETLERFLKWFGKQGARSLRAVCSDTRQACLKVIWMRPWRALQVLDGFPVADPSTTSPTLGLGSRGDGTCLSGLPRDTLQGNGWLGHAYHDRAVQVPAGRRRGPIRFLPACNQATVAAGSDPLGSGFLQTTA